jgi:glycosyltransferase involved in cell wall biosynthesis
MDLVAGMLLDQLRLGFSSDFEVTRICPPMQRRFGRVPLLQENRSARKADQFINRFYNYPRYLRSLQKQFDIFHVIDHTYAHLVHELPRARTVVTCHDLDAFRCLLEPDREPRSQLFRSMSRRILNGVREAGRVTCGSSAVRQEILRHDILPEDRLTVIPYGVDPSCTGLANPSADARIETLLGAATGSATDILHVGSTVPRKRIETLLKIFAEVRAVIPAARLIRVGGPFTASQAALAAELNVMNSVVVLPFLERDALAAVYRRASVVLQPSAREGFGLPIVEAMACGTPVVASDLPVIREVGAGAAMYCPVGDVPAWSARILDLLSKRNTPGEWDAIRTACIQHAAKFSWPEYAARTAQVYRELM